MKYFTSGLIVLLMMSMALAACNFEGEQQKDEGAKEMDNQEINDADKPMKGKAQMTQQGWNNAMDRIDDIIGQLKNKMGTASPESKEEYQQLITDLKELRKDVVKASEGAIDEMDRNSSELLDDVQDKLKESYKTLREDRQKDG